MIFVLLLSIFLLKNVSQVVPTIHLNKYTVNLWALEMDRLKVTVKHNLILFSIQSSGSRQEEEISFGKGRQLILNASFWSFGNS